MQGSPADALCLLLLRPFASLMTTPEQVVVHPLVLLSVVDHYNRVAKDTRKRVIGLLLGETHIGRTDVTNSFAGALTCCHRRSVVRGRPRTPRRTCSTVVLLSQCLSRRMTGTRPSGSSITATWKTCSTCTNVSTVRSVTFLAQMRMLLRQSPPSVRDVGVRLTLLPLRQAACDEVYDYQFLCP